MRAVRKSAGFTLVEIMIVVAIIGVFSIVAVPELDEWFDRMRVKGAARTVADTHWVS